MAQWAGASHVKLGILAALQQSRPGRPGDDAASEVDPTTVLCSSK